MILSISGIFKMILMIVGALVLIRFIGQLLVAKRNMEEERKLNEENRKFHQAKKESLKSFGKTKIINNKKDLQGHVQDVDYQEVDE